MNVVLMRSCQEGNSIQLAYSQMSDSLKIATDKNGVQYGHIQVLRMENERAFLRMKTQDSTVAWLQGFMKEYKGKLNTAIVYSNSTTSLGSSVTSFLAPDTIKRDSLIYLYPKYKTAWENKWESGKIEATKDSIFRSIKIKNEYEISIGKLSNGWFKKKEYEVLVRNLNPNTEIQELRSFQVKEKPKRIGLGVHAGYGIDLVSFRPAPYIGIGIGYNILGIK